MTPRLRAEAKEAAALGPGAARSASHRGRERPEEPCQVRTAFQDDCHRIVRSKAFRRLKGKTQVFLWPEGDHYRTRLTHCQEVSQIARTLARALDLNEDLTEAISLGHDLGHTPFGHAGEAAMERLIKGGFRHEQQSLRVVEKLENDGQGLNLTWEVRDGILRHSKGAGSLLLVDEEQLPRTLEGQVVRLADVIAYVHHDLDDAVRAKVLDAGDLPGRAKNLSGSTYDDHLARIVLDIARNTNIEKEKRISMSDECAEELEEIRSFLYQKVYYNEVVHAEFGKACALIERLMRHFVEDLDRFYSVYWPSALRDGPPEDDIRDFLAGMTDAFAVNLHDKIFTPRRWYIY